MNPYLGNTHHDSFLYTPPDPSTGSLLHELLGSDVAMPSAEQFEQEVEDFLLNCGEGDYAPTLPDFDPYAFNVIDWTAALTPSAPPPVSPPSTVVSDDCSWAPLSPVSDTTLYSDFSSSLQKDAGYEHDGCNTTYSRTSFPTTAPTGTPDGAAFTFESRSQLSRHDPGNPLPEGDSGALDARAYSPGLVSHAMMDPFASYTAYPPQPSSPFPGLQLSLPPAVADNRSPSVESTESEDLDDDYVEKKPAKRKRVEPTDRQFHCPYEGCTSEFARSHNLKVHVDSVHQKKREYVCKSCKQPFARNHDLTRHFQSKHTDLGSPRNKSVAKRKQK